MTVAIIVHGGAGDWNKDRDQLAVALQACREAAESGRKALLGGASALDAVEIAVNILEDCPVLDAGRGSFINLDGAVEMDALIMDGQTLALGAVAAVQRVRHPVSLARRVMTESGHQFLVGAGADSFADAIGFPRCELTDLLVEPDGGVSVPGATMVTANTLGDTVGAAAIDMDGNLAAATSTGGTRNKLPGRVGDSPLVGSGAYADNWSAAVSATGYGEALMRVVISKQVCDFVKTGLSAMSACRAAISLLAERTEGQGGLIAIDSRGHIGYAYNAAAMPWAYASERSPVISGG